MTLKNTRGANLARWIREDPHAKGNVANQESTGVAARFRRQDRRCLQLCYSLIRLLHAHARRPPCPAAFPVRGAFHSRAIHAALSVSACSCCSMSARRQRVDRPPTLMGLGNLLSRVQRQIVAAETAKRCATCSTVSHSLPFAYAMFCPALCFVAEHYRGGTTAYKADQKKPAEPERNPVIAPGGPNIEFHCPSTTPPEKKIVFAIDSGDSICYSAITQTNKQKETAT